jgi:hypothetical protein
MDDAKTKFKAMDPELKSDFEKQLKEIGGPKKEDLQGVEL